MGSSDKVVAPGSPDKVVARSAPHRPTAQAMNRRMAAAMSAGLVLMVGGGMAVWAAARSQPVIPASQTIPPMVSASLPLSDALSDTIKVLQRTQEQTVDQLQMLQDQLAAEKQETRRLSHQVAGMADELGALQTKVINLPASPSATAILAPKSHH